MLDLRRLQKMERLSAY